MITNENNAVNIKDTNFKDPSIKGANIISILPSELLGMSLSTICNDDTINNIDATDNHEYNAYMQSTIYTRQHIISKTFSNFAQYRLLYAIENIESCIKAVAGSFELYNDISYIDRTLSITNIDTYINKYINKYNSQEIAGYLTNNIIIIVYNFNLREGANINIDNEGYTFIYNIINSAIDDILGLYNILSQYNYDGLYLANNSSNIKDKQF